MRKKRPILQMAEQYRLASEAAAENKEDLDVIDGVTRFGTVKEPEVKEMEFKEDIVAIKEEVKEEEFKVDLKGNSESLVVDQVANSYVEDMFNQVALN